MLALAIGGAASAAAPLGAGANPQPVTLVRPATAPLSAMAQLGRRIFFDRTLSSSHAIACADCHSPQHAFGPPSALPRPGLRAVPSLMYLERQPNFSIGPDDPESEGATTTASVPASSATAVPQGGLFWDGRANTLQDQALGPLLDPSEMDGRSVDRVATMLRRAAYAPSFAQLFGPRVFDRASMLVAEALFAVARYEFEDSAFHPYASKYDAWLEGKARFTPAEARGYRLFNDPHGANCAACHLDRPTADGLPPLFTDHQYEALGVPRNPELTENRDPAFFDLGICGPVRTDLRTSSAYCGMFATPTLRNVATRHVFFHNGVYHSLAQVLDFYNERDAPGHHVAADLPARYRANIDHTDAPFDRGPGARPVMSARDERDIIAFLGTLTDR